MLNEFVYCPPLFYYVHVEGVFLHSADTKKSAAEHTRVDAGKGDLPLPQQRRPMTVNRKQRVAPSQPGLPAHPISQDDLHAAALAISVLPGARPR